MASDPPTDYMTGMEAKSSEIVCPVLGKIVWVTVCGESGEVSRYKTEFDEFSVIGVGGYGCVFESSNKLDGQRYAIKKIMLQVTGMDFDHAVREVKAMAVMSHPNVVRYHSAWVERRVAGEYFEAGEEKESYEIPEVNDGPVLYIQQELCSGTLSTKLSDGVLEEKNKLKIFKDVVLGLHHIHGKGVRHGDLSPNNIFFDEEGNAKIGDFGLASLIEPGVFEPNSPRAADYFYSAPELKEGKYNLLSDIYSLGMMLAQMFGGYSTDMERIKALNDLKKYRVLSLHRNDNNEMKDFILSLTDPNPDHRPSTSTILSIWQNVTSPTI